MPKKGWRRGFRYIGKRVQRLPDTPHRIAIGFSCGVLASFSPFFTLHILVALAYALLVRGNLIAAAFGTIFGNPLSFPLIAALSLKTGNWILARNDGVEDLDHLTWAFVTEKPFAFLESIFTPYLIGGLVPGIVSAAVCYALLRPVVARFQDRRRTVLETRARDLIARRLRAGRNAGGADSQNGGEPGVMETTVATSARPRAARPTLGVAGAVKPTPERNTG
ncbi:MAG: DUF2062 domain-containing protein [Pseudomonadota bacterium]